MNTYVHVFTHTYMYNVSRSLSLYIYIYTHVWIFCMYSYRRIDIHMRVVYPQLQLHEYRCGNGYTCS